MQDHEHDEIRVMTDRLEALDDRLGDLELRSQLLFAELHIEPQRLACPDCTHSYPVGAVYSVVVNMEDIHGHVYIFGYTGIAEDGYVLELDNNLKMNFVLDSRAIAKLKNMCTDMISARNQETLKEALNSRIRKLQEELEERLEQLKP